AAHACGGERDLEAHFGLDRAQELVAEGAHVRLDAPARRLAQARAGLRARERKIERALEQPRDVARLRPPARRARTRELRDQVVQQLAEAEFPREQRLEPAYVPQAVAVAALRVRDQTREIERRWLCAQRWSGRHHRRHASERLRTGDRRAQRAAEEARRRGQPAPVVPL